MRRAAAAVLASALALVLAAPSGAHAKSWCAYPLWVHEWGVHVFDGAGRPRATGLLPDFFHREVTGTAAAGPAVRELPADGGERDLPVVHFYSPRRGDGVHIPVGLEVGFTGGPASTWFPQVDLFRSAAAANGPTALAARASLVALRAARAAAGTWVGGPDGKRAPLPEDPTRQLVWSRLELTDRPPREPAATDVPWVRAARGLDALWVSRGDEAERFVFYEAESREALPLALVRGATYGPGRRHYELVNRGPDAVHDVFVVHREGGRAFVFFAPQIPARASAGFLLEDHEVTGREGPATEDALRAVLVDPTQPTPPATYDWNVDRCVMQRDPALPVEEADGHRLYRGEVDTLLGVWRERFFGQPGTTILYREDQATLGRAMPLSVYTDMYNFVVLRRAGLALWERVPLP